MTEIQWRYWIRGLNGLNMENKRKKGYGKSYKYPLRNWNEYIIVLYLCKNRKIFFDHGMTGLLKIPPEPARVKYAIISIYSRNELCLCVRIHCFFLANSALEKKWAVVRHNKFLASVLYKYSLKSYTGNMPGIIISTRYL